MCLEGKNVLQACSFNPKPVLKHAAAQCHAWHCRRDTALLHDLLSKCHERKSRSYLLLHQTGGKEQEQWQRCSTGSPAEIKVSVCHPPC